jgi:hypothetical protein
MKIEVFNLTFEQIHESLGRFGSISNIQEKTSVPFDVFLSKINKSRLDFIDKYKNSSLFYANSPIGDVIKMPMEHTIDNSKIVILESNNLSVGKEIFVEGNIFLVSNAYHFELEPYDAYNKIVTEKLYYEISKTIRPKIGCHIQLCEIPVGELLEQNEFTSLTGVELQDIRLDIDRKKYLPTGQEPLYVANNYYKYQKKFVCRPQSRLYITSLKIVDTL